jgi:hypothetical protein
VSETWYPFGSGDARWVDIGSDVRRWEQGWSSSAITRDAWGRRLREGGLGGATAGITALAVAEDGALAILSMRGDWNDTQLTLCSPEGDPLRTTALPSASSLAYDGTYAYCAVRIDEGRDVLRIHDTRDDSSLLVEIPGVEAVSACDLHVVPETDELWIVDPVGRALLRFALPR